MLASPVPIQTVLGSDSETARSPVESVGKSLFRHSQVIPEFSVFQTPPVADPM